MKVILIEKQPFFRDIDVPEQYQEPVWFNAGEEFEVVETKVMKHDNLEWYKLKSKYFTNPLKGFHRPDSFKRSE